MFNTTTENHQSKSETEILADIEELKANAAKALEEFKKAKALKKENDENKFESALTAIKCYRQLNLPKYANYVSFIERYQHSQIIEELAEPMQYRSDKKSEGTISAYYFQILYHWDADKNSNLLIHTLSPASLKPLLQRFWWWEDMSHSLNIGFGLEGIFNIVVPVILEDPFLEPEEREYLWEKLSEETVDRISGRHYYNDGFFSKFINFIDETIPALLNKYPGNKEIINFLVKILSGFRKNYLRRHQENEGISEISDTPTVREGFFQWQLKGLDKIAGYANTPELKMLLRKEYAAIPTGTYAAGRAQLRLADMAAAEGHHSPERLLAIYQPYYEKAAQEFKAVDEKIADDETYLTRTDLPESFLGYYYYSYYLREKSTAFLKLGLDKLTSLNYQAAIDEDKELAEAKLKSILPTASLFNISKQPVSMSSNHQSSSLQRSENSSSEETTIAVAELLKNYSLTEIKEMLSNSEYEAEFDKLIEEIECRDKTLTLCCPISLGLMWDPVYYTVNERKQIFDRPNIESHKETSKQCPLTRANIPDGELSQDIATADKIKQLIISEIEKRKWNFKAIDAIQRMLSESQKELLMIENELAANPQLKSELMQYLDIPTLSISRPNHDFSSESDSKALAITIREECGLIKPSTPSPELKSLMSRHKVAETKLADAKQQLITKNILSEKTLHEIEQGACTEHAKFHPELQNLYPSHLKGVKFDKSSQELKEELRKVRNAYNNYDYADEYFRCAFGVFMLGIGIPLFIITAITHAIHKIETTVEISNLQPAIVDAEASEKWEKECTKKIKQSPEEKLKFTFFSCRKQMNNSIVNNAVTINKESAQLPPRLRA